MKRYVFPSVFILGGLFFMLIPIIGSTPENAKHTGTLNAISFFFGLFVTVVAVYNLVKGIRAR